MLLKSSFKNIYNLIIFNFKNLNFLFVLSLICLNLSCILVFGLLFSSSTSFILISFFCIFMSISISYVSITYRIRHSTLWISIQNSNISKIQNYLASFISIFFIAFFLYFIQLIFYIFLNKIGIVSDFFVWESFSTIKKYVNWGVIDYWAILYYFTCMFLITYALCYIINKFIKEQKTFYIIIFILLVWTFVLGGVFGTPFYYIRDNALISANYFKGKTTFAPTFYQKILLLNPFFAINQFSSAIIFGGHTFSSTGMPVDYSEISIWSWSPDPSKNYSIYGSIIWIIFLYSIAFVLSRYKK